MEPTAELINGVRATFDSAGGHVASVPGSSEGPPSFETVDAAVLIAVTECADPAVALIVKASNLRTHGGEVALPGGRRDARDQTLSDTALREAWEETGLPQQSVEYLGTMSPAESKHGLQVAPCVALIPPDTRLKADRDEAQEVFFWPLRELIEDRRIGVDSLERPSSVLHVPAYDWGGRRIWGLTSQLLVRFSNACLGTRIEITNQARPGL